MANRFRKLAQKPEKRNIEDLLYGPNQTQDNAGFTQLKHVLRTKYDSLKKVNWYLPDDWTRKLAITIKNMVEEAVEYNEQYVLDLVNEGQLKAPESQLGEPSENIKPVIDRIRNVRKMQ